MYACHGDHPMCVHELLTQGADFSVENLCDETAFDLACKLPEPTCELTDF
jgi:hypothetical protein